MSDEQSARSPASPPSTAAKTDARFGPHFPLPTFPTTSNESASSENAQARVDVPNRSKPRDPSLGDKPPSEGGRSPQLLRKEQQLLLEASRVAEHLQQHFAELDRREEQITRQREQLEQQRHQIQQAANELERELSLRTADLKTREDGFHRQAADCEQLINELEAQQQALADARDELDLERSRLRQELHTERGQLREIVKEELHTDFQQLELAREELAVERRRFADDVEQHRRDHEALLEQVDQQLEFEREKLLEAVRAELAAERQQIQTERDRWETQQQQERRQLEQSRRELEQRQQAQLAEFANQREQAEQTHQQQVRAWEQHRDAERQTLNQERETLERDQQRAQETFAAEREQFNQDCNTRQQQFQQEQATGEQRLRFQRDHLHKLRNELEATQHEFQREKQHTTQHFAGETEVLRLRKIQLDEYRQRLTDREASMDRELELFKTSQADFLAESEADRDRLLEDRQRFEQERHAMQSELDHQRQSLAQLADTLTARETRMETLRQEMEQTHRQSLETRLAIEEAWAHLAQAAGLETAQQGVEEARAAIAGQIRQLNREADQKRAALIAERHQLHDAQTAFETEQQTLADWMTDRDQTLRGWEAQLQEQSLALEFRETKWRALRDQWTDEKREAERIIRDLLKQLGNP